MEVIIVAAWVASYLWIWLEIRALQNRCTYLEHLYRDLLNRERNSEVVEGDEWKDGAANEES